MMSLEAVGFYVRLLNYQWVEGSIPAEVDTLDQLLGLPLNTSLRLWPEVEKVFKKDSRSGRFKNPRLDLERKAAAKKRKSLQIRGKMQRGNVGESTR